MRKGAPVDRSLEKAPHSPAGSCSALVLLVQCWWSSCPPPPPPKNTPATPPRAPQLPSMCRSSADSLDPRPRHMEARPGGLLSNVLHSWGSAGGGSSASRSLLLSAPTCYTISVDRLKMGRSTRSAEVIHKFSFTSGDVEPGRCCWLGHSNRF